MTARADARSAPIRSPFALPARLPASLARVRAYWSGLLRGEARIPFWDDLKPTELPDPAERLLLIDVFERPTRFRFNSVGKEVACEPVAGRFLDEIEPGPRLEFLASQCSATVEGCAPTFFRGTSIPGGSAGEGYSRLLLPLWGDGRIGMLLGAFDLG